MAGINLFYQIFKLRKTLIILIFIVCSQFLLSQVYTEKQTRHRFSQMTLGLDFKSSFGGNTTFFDKI